MTGLFAHLSDARRARLKQAEQPDWTAPMLATLTDRRFSDPGWIYERKLDGERALAFRKGDRLRLVTRNRKEIGATYPELIEALERQDCDDFIVDGEIVAFDGAVTSFSRLQQRMQISDPDAARTSGVTVYFYLFDILHLDRHRLDALGQRSRKALLKRAIAFDGPLRFTPHRNATGEAFFDAACRKGWEGIIAKRADAPYSHGRSTDWLKFKCASGQELVIGGFTAPQGKRKGFGALLVGYYEDGKLRYAGKVGTGFDDDFLTRFHERLESLARDTSPFDDEVGEGDVTWVAPKLVGNFGFTEWTTHGKLRHPRFLGLRRDKPAKDVVRERPKG
ncbi:MAG: non-homologous end-joining DNA ligase [Paracoccaceae bacterium]